MDHQIRTARHVILADAAVPGWTQIASQPTDNHSGPDDFTIYVDSNDPVIVAAMVARVQRVRNSD